MNTLVGERIPALNTTIAGIRESQLSRGLYIVKLEGFPEEVSIRLQPTGEVTGPGVDRRIVQFFQHKLNLLGVGIPVRERNFQKAMKLFDEKGYTQVYRFGVKPFHFVVRFRNREFELLYDENDRVVALSQRAYDPETGVLAVRQQAYNPETERYEDATEDTQDLLKRLTKLLETRGVAEMMLKKELPQGVGKDITKYLGGRKSRRRQRRRKTRRTKNL